MLDRTKAPAFQVPDKFKLAEAEKVLLKNSIPLSVISTGTQPAIRVEFVFNAGVWQEPENGVSYFTGKLLTAGTAKYSANLIEDTLAGFGAFLEINPANDHVTVTLYCLHKHLDQILPFLHEVFTGAVFPAEELENQKNILIQQIRVNKEKTNYLSSIAFKEHLYGQNHPYGRSLSEQDVQNITTEQLRTYHQTAFSSFNCEIFVAGNPGPYQSIFNNHFGIDSWGKEVKQITSHQTKFTPGETEIPKEGSLQTSVRLGYPLFKVSHPDYFPMSVVNELLGGYFGSRLMKNIRENKGYTYGIHSNVVSMLHDGYWVTGTDVKKENARDTVDEIHKEIEKIKNELVPEYELDTVKNILRGSFLNSINTPFAIADKLKTIHYHNLPPDYYNRYFDFIEQVTPEQVQETAQKYFKQENYVTILAG